MTEQWPSRTSRSAKSSNAPFRVGMAMFLIWAAGCAAPTVEPESLSSGATRSAEAPSEFTTGALAGDLFGGAIMHDPTMADTSPGPGGPAPSEVAATLASAKTPDDPEVGSDVVSDLDSGVETRMGSAAEEAGVSDGVVVSEGIPTTRDRDRSLSMAIADLDRRLHTLASDADDPMQFEMIRALLAILAVEELELGEEIPFAPASIGLLSEEEDLLIAVRAFAKQLRERLAVGEESSRDILLDELQGLLTRLQNDDGLALGTVEICSSIRGFGDVVAVPRRMATGTDHLLLIYAELEGLEWAPRADAGRVGWQVEHRLELHQLADDMVIDPGVPATIGQDLAAAVDDTYFWIQYTLPAADLKAGRYVLKLWIREPATGREVERSIPIDLLPARLIARSPDQR